MVLAEKRASLDDATADLERRRELLLSEQESLATDRTALESTCRAVENDLKRCGETDSLVQTRLQELKATETAIKAERTAIDIARAAVERDRTDLERQRQDFESTRVELAAAQRALEAERNELHAELRAMASQAQKEATVAANRPVILEGELVDSDGRTAPRQPLDGSWKLIAVEAFGREIPALSLRRQRIVWEFKGNRLLHRPEIGHLRESNVPIGLNDNARPDRRDSAQWPAQVWDLFARERSPAGWHLQGQESAADRIFHKGRRWAANSRIPTRSELTTSDRSILG